MPVRIVVVVVQLVAPFFFPSLEWLAYLATTLVLYIRTPKPPKDAESFWNCLPTGTSSCATEALVNSRMPSSMVPVQCPRVYDTRGWYQSAMIGGFVWWVVA